MTFFFAIWRFLLAHRWKVGIGIVILLVALGIASYVRRPRTDAYLTEIARSGDLRQTVEVVGTIISEKDLELQFRTAGIIAEVNVKEGDNVQVGQTLARLRAGDLAANVAAAAARMRQAEATLRALKEGTRPEEIAVAEAQLMNKKASLETAKATLRTAQENHVASETKLTTLKQEAATALAGQVSIAASTAAAKLTIAEQSLSSVHDVFEEDDVNDAVSRNKAFEYQSLQLQETAARNALLTVRAKPSPTDYKEAILLMEQTQATITQAIGVLTSAYDLVISLPETAYLTNADKETHKSTLATKRSSAQTALTDIDTWVKNLKDDAASYDTRIATEESSLISAKGTEEKAQADIQTYETSILIDEANLALKRAGTRQSDIDASQANLDALRADVARASAALADAVIAAPIAGRVTKVNIKVGEASPAGPAITMIGESPYRVEAMVSEIDVPKIQLTQSGSIELDAFPDMYYKLLVSEIDETQTLVDGVVKYRVKLDFQYPHEEFKIGMSGDITILTGERKDVVIIPSRAVITNEGSEKVVRVIGSGGTVTHIPVETGMEGEGGDMEIKTGLRGGETVIVLTIE